MQLKWNGFYRYRHYLSLRPSSSSTTPLPYSKIPRISLLRATADVLLSDPDRSHIDTIGHFDHFGDVFRVPFGHNTDVLCTRSPAAVASIFRNESRYPERYQPELPKYIRASFGLPLSALLADGEEWLRMRRAIDKPLATNVARLVPALNEIALDAIGVFTASQERLGYGKVMHQLRNYLFRWAIESIAQFVFGARFGCLKSHLDAPPDSMGFVEALEDTFRIFEQFRFASASFVRWAHPLKFSEYRRAWATIIHVIEGRVKKAIEAPETSAGFLGDLVRSGRLSKEEMVSTIVELLSAGIETTSISVVWLLYNLAHCPDKQEAIVAEMRRANVGETITEEYLRSGASYLKAAFRESSRLFPVVLGNTRRLAQDTILCGYSVPAGTLVYMCDFAMGRNEQFFPNAMKFEPERWLTKEDSEVRAFASSAFGFGPRMCAGRRFAELETYVLVANLLNHYRLVGQNKVEARSGSLMVPKQAVLIQLVPRGKQ